MRIHKKIAVFAIAAALALASLVPAATAQAAQKTASEKAVTNTYLSTFYNVYSATGLTINGKAYNKLSKSLKKKVSVKVTSTNKNGFQYATSSYTSAGSPSYKYVPTSDYTVFFKKAGTYTLKYKTYSHDDGNEYYFEEFGTDPVEIPRLDEYGNPVLDDEGNPVYDTEDVPYYYLETYTPSSGYSFNTSVKYYQKQDANYVTYYTNSIDAVGTKVYARNMESYSYVPVTLNGNVITFKPVDYKVTTHTMKVIVKNTDAIISSVKLGSALNTYSDQEFEGGYNYTRTVKPLLKGKKGKLVVKPAKGYKVMDIVVQTYDKNGKPVYKLVKNKKKVSFGKYKMKDSYDYKETGYSYGWINTGLYKTTRIYVFYKDTGTGGYTDIKKIKKDASGNYVFTYNYRSDSSHPVEKNQTTIGYAPMGFSNTYTFLKN